MNQTIYFRKEVWDKFKDESQKSDLINLLLSRHYEYYHPGTLIEEVSDESIVGNADLAKTLKPMTSNFCRGGHLIPTGRDRCLGKGCEYS